MHGLVTSTSRLTLTSSQTLLRSGRNLRALSGALVAQHRTLGTSPSVRKGQWRNDTPEGSLTEIHVYTPPSDIGPTVWPEKALGVFATIDPRFDLPGNIGAVSSIEKKSIPPLSDPVASKRRESHSFEELTQSPSGQERQTQTLYSASDYIQHTPDAEADLCQGLLDGFPEFRGMETLSCEVTDAPTLLKREAEALFPGENIANAANLSVVTISQRTVNDMSTWSHDMEEEREALTEQFFSAAKEIVARLKDEGYWADFIDPSSGTPYYGQHSSTTMFETDEKFRLLGFRIEDLGCCKVISHRDFGRNVFVGTIFTNAPTQVGVIQDLFADLKLALSSTSDS